MFNYRHGNGGLLADQMSLEDSRGGEGGNKRRPAEGLFAMRITSVNNEDTFPGTIAPLPRSATFILLDQGPRLTGFVRQFDG
jgi:hypothetical protein